MNVACGILVPQPGIEPGPLEVEAQSPNHWSIREPLLGHLFGGAQCDPLQSPKRAELSAPTFCPNQLSPGHLTPGSYSPRGHCSSCFPWNGHGHKSALLSSSSHESSSQGAAVIQEDPLGHLVWGITTGEAHREPVFRLHCLSFSTMHQCHQATSEALDLKSTRPSSQ